MKRQHYVVQVTPAAVTHIAANGGLIALMFNVPLDTTFRSLCRHTSKPVTWQVWRKQNLNQEKQTKKYAIAANNGISIEG